MKFGDAIGRISAPLEWIEEEEFIIAYDGNKNPAAKIRKDDYVAHYTHPSVRLVAGPDAPWHNLGNYRSISDAKKIAELHEQSEAIPVFKPGKLVGWVDKKHTIKLIDQQSPFQRLFAFLRRNILRELK